MRRAILLLGCAVAGRAGADELVVDFSGRVQTDLQLRLEEKSRGGPYDRQVLVAGPERAEAVIGAKLDATYGRWKGVAHIDFAADAFTDDLDGFEDLTHHARLNPVSVEVKALYVDMKGLFVDGLDVRIGQQVIAWGVGDQFNPTNNLNPDDLTDVLLFGKQTATFMARADWWLTDDLSLSGVLQPVFKPALVPRSAALGAGAIERLPFVDDPLRWRVESETAASSSSVVNAPTVLEAAVPVEPEASLENMVFSFRLADSVFEQDLAASYYYGRTDFPVPFANHTRLDKMAPECAGGACAGLLKTTAQLGYPRMQVFGLNAAGEIPLSWISEGLNGIGYRLEAALILPEAATIRLTNDELDLPVAPQPAGEYDYDNDGMPGGPLPEVVSDTPFAKWAVGLDYSFGGHWYVNAQWVHGLPDEYGAGDWISEGRAVRDSGVTTPEAVTLIQCALPRNGTTCARETYRPRLGDYLVLGVDLRLMNNALLIRLFNILDLSGMTDEVYDANLGRRVQTKHSPFSEEGFSAVIYPELNYNFGNGLDLGLGLLLQLGNTNTKFGDPAAGGSLGWMRARLAF